MVGEEKQNHLMILQTTHESGAEEWYCPTCGRRFLMQWPPNYKKIILEPGDEYAMHSGGTGGLTIGMPKVLLQEQQLPTDEPEVDDPNLIPWEQWMEEVNFERLWREDPQ